MCSAVILGLKETEERYYMLVKDSKRYQEASMNCRWRGGNLVMPKTSHTNQLMAEYISQAGLTRVYIGVEVQNRDSVSGATLTHTFSHTGIVGWIKLQVSKTDSSQAAGVPPVFVFRPVGAVTFTQTPPARRPFPPGVLRWS